jgi:cysteine desulfurase
MTYEFTRMIYFDNNATTQLAPEAVEAMLPYLSGDFGNPSSAHSAGASARRAVHEARADVAEMLGADLTEIVFTASGTEADNWAILGTVDPAQKQHIVATRVEHEAVRKVIEQLERSGQEVSWLDVDSNGMLDLSALRGALRPETALASIMLANNETGIIFPMDEIGQIVKENSNAKLHVDGVNAAGKMKIDLSTGNIDLLAISAHKFHGPKGIGALFIRKGVNIKPMFCGGGQEFGRRAGTEAVHQLAGMGAACRLASGSETMGEVGKLRDRLEQGILAAVPNTYLNGGADAARLPNTSNISFENTNGEMLMSRLSDLDICVSTGSACHSADHTSSAVLQAMNVPYSRAMGAIRFSLGRYNTSEEVERLLDVLPGVVSEIRSLSGQN